MSDFQFCDMLIQRMAVHTVYARGVGNERKAPLCYDELIVLDSDSADVMQSRLTNALGNRSHGVAMTVSKKDPASFFHKASSVMSAGDADFLAMTKQFAVDLTDAQTNPRWPGGVLIVVSGQVGAPSKPFVAVIKAEPDKGFSVVEENGKVSLKLIKKMLLSETQRLYKVGMLIERAAVRPDHDGLFDPMNYHAFLFDHLLTSNEVGKAAAYFYDTFLGLSIASSTRAQTRLFFEETMDFINKSRADSEQKYTYREALRTELKSQVATLNLDDFAKRTFPEELQKPYVEQVRKKGFPEQAIVKDNEYIKSKLRKPRNVKFTSGVLIKVPAEQEFKDLVVISESAEGYTNVRIAGAVEDQE
jgi:nucleoid-associated protein YejK